MSVNFSDKKTNNLKQTFIFVCGTRLINNVKILIRKIEDVL